MTFPQIETPPQALAEVVVNENFDALSHQAVYAKAYGTTSGLIWGYYGGYWRSFLVTAGTLSLTNNATNYIVVALATGVISVSSTNTNWNNSTDYARVYKVTTLSSAVTAIEDHRYGGGLGGGGAGGASSVIAWKQPVRAASTGNGTLASAFENGDTLDGVTLVTGDRILLKDQSTGSQNGIYTVNASGAPTRGLDADDSDELVGAIVFVSEGTTNADRIYGLTTNAPITVGSTSLTWTQQGSGIAPLTTKGDLYTYSTVAARLAVGANYSHLMADSSATTGNKWVLNKSVPLAYFGTLANDGSTDDAAVFATAIASGVKHIDARGLNCAILTQVDLAAGVTLDISGSSLTTTGSTIATFKATNIDDWHIIARGATILGAGTTVGSAKGLWMVGGQRWSVTGLRAKNIKGWGFYVQPGSTPASTPPRGDQGVLTDCWAETCYWGWEDEAGQGAEYIVNNNFRTSGCTTWGVKTAAGNIQWNGGQDVDNTGDGFQVLGGATNNAHGLVSNRSINHNGGVGVSLAGVTNGQTFVGCHVYQNSVLFDGCKDVTFTGGKLDPTSITINSGSGSGLNFITGVDFVGGYGTGGSGVPTINGTAPTTLYGWCNAGDGCPKKWISVRQCVAVACSDESSALTTGTAKTTFRMPFPFYLDEIRASVTTAPTGTGNLTVDVNEGGTTVISTKLTFDASEKSTVTAATPPVISDHDLADDAEMTVDIDAVSGTITGTGLKVYLIGYVKASA